MNRVDEPLRADGIVPAGLRLPDLGGCFVPLGAERPDLPGSVTLTFADTEGSLHRLTLSDPLTVTIESEPA